MESQPELPNSAFVKTFTARTRRKRPDCVESRLKQTLQCRSSCPIDGTCNHEWAQGKACSGVPSTRFRLSIRLFSVRQAFSDFPRGALATTVSQTRSLHGRLPPALPPKRNFLFEFARGTLAVAIPNTRNFREWPAQPANIIPIIQIRRNRGLLHMSISSEAPISHGSIAGWRVASTATDDLSAGALPSSIAIAFLDFVFSPAFP